MQIEYKTDIPEKVKVLRTMRRSVFYPAKKRAGGKTGYFFMEEVREFIEKGGEGWPDVHPMTKALEKRGGKWRQRRGKYSPLENLGKFARYQVARGAYRVEVGFGTFKSGSAGKFSRQLQQIAHKVQKRQVNRVTPKMQRLMGATKQRKSAAIGKDFFPVRANTTLITDARKIMEPVFKKKYQEAWKLFQDRYEKDILARFERL